MIIDPNNVETCDTRYIQSMSGSILTSPKHNLYINNYILIDGCVGSTNLNEGIYPILAADDDTITISTASTGTYLGGGVIRLLSNVKITSKMFTPFWGYGRRYRLKYAEYLFDNTDNGEVICNVFVDTKDTDSTNDPNNPNNLDAGATESCLIGSNVVFTKPETLYATQQLAQDVIWHRQYYSTEGETFQVQINLSADQLQDLTIVDSNIVLHAIIFHFEVAGTFQ